MEQNKQLVSQSSQSTGLQTLSQTATKLFNSLEPEVKALLACYPTRDKEKTYPTLSSACSDDDAPSLAKIDKDYGDGTSVLWLSVQLIHVASYTGICEKLRWDQLEDTARHILQVGKQWGITLPEMMVFFTRFEQGYYQQFIGYERPNPQVIMKSFQCFLKDDRLDQERMRSFQEKEKERMDREREEARKNAVPMPDNIAERLSKLYTHFNANENKD